MSAAHKSESPGATGLNAETQKQNTNACILVPATDVRELQANLIARLEIIGHHVHKLERGFLITRWGETKLCPDLVALENFARIVGAVK